MPVQFNPLAEQGLKHLLPSLPTLPVLEDLNLAGIDLQVPGSPGARLLVSYFPQLNTLKRLTLGGGNPFFDAGGAVIAQHLSILTGLQYLNLDGVGLSIDSYELLVPAVRALTSLQRADMYDNDNSGIEGEIDLFVHIWDTW